MEEVVGEKKEGGMGWSSSGLAGGSRGCSPPTPRDAIVGRLL